MRKPPTGKRVGVFLALGKSGSFCSLNQNYFNTPQLRQAPLQQKCENSQLISCTAAFAPLLLCNTCLVAVGKAWFNPQLTEQCMTDDEGSLGGKASFSPAFFLSFSTQRPTTKNQREEVGWFDIFYLTIFCYMHFKHFEISGAFHLWIQRSFVWGSKITG